MSALRPNAATVAATCALSSRLADAVTVGPPTTQLRRTSLAGGITSATVPRPARTCDSPGESASGKNRLSDGFRRQPSTTQTLRPLWAMETARLAVIVL